MNMLARFALPLAVLLGAGTAHATTLSVVAVDPSMIGAVDRDSIKLDGDMATADIVAIPGDPEVVSDAGSVTTAHLRLDCKGRRVGMAGGETQGTGARQALSAEDWAPIDPGSPAEGTFNVVCLKQAADPARTFASVEALKAFYADFLKQAAAATPPDPRH